MKTIYLLYYDTEYGDPEEWNTFYTPVEAFDSVEKREARIEELKKTPMENYEFHEVEVELN